MIGMSLNKKAPETLPSPVPPVPPPRRRRARVPMILLILVLLMVGATWTGYRLYDEPFQLFNQNRIGAVADKLWRNQKAVAVVALGSTPLRHATLDESAMAKLGARHGIKSLLFLRIVNETAEFADFEPMLEHILRLRPALVLLDLDLAFVERKDLFFYPAYLELLADVVERGRPYLRDQVELQYGKPCARRDTPDWEASANPNLHLAELRAMLDLRADSPALDRVRSFVVTARAAGIRVALLPLPKTVAVAGPLSVAPDRAAEHLHVPVWSYPHRLDDRRDFCDFAHLTPEAREAYSDWLTGQIAEALSRPAVEEVSSLAK